MTAQILSFEMKRKFSNTILRRSRSLQNQHLILHGAAIAVKVHSGYSHFTNLVKKNCTLIIFILPSYTISFPTNSVNKFSVFI